MVILFLHGWNSVPGGVKPTSLQKQGHTVINPKLPDDDFDEAVRIAQAEYDRHEPDVVVGSSRGGAVAMNINSGDTPLVLLCPAWKKWGTATAVKPNTVILHSRADDVIPFEGSEELIGNSGLSGAALTVVGNDHRLADQEPLQAMLAACERLAHNHSRTGELPNQRSSNNPPMTLPPSTERLSFREWTADDLDAFHLICSDPAVMRFVGDGQCWSRHISRQFIERSIVMTASEGFCRWPLIHSADLSFVFADPDALAQRRRPQTLIPSHANAEWRGFQFTGNQDNALSPIRPCCHGGHNHLLQFDATQICFGMTNRRQCSLAETASADGTQALAICRTIRRLPLPSMNSSATKLQ